MNTILLLEDDENLNRGISLKLAKEGYQVLSAASIQEAKKLFSSHEVSMVLSDITLPDGNGLSFGQWVREKSDVYLVYLTALDQEIDIVNGYDTGADDYITKPFSVNVLMSKVNALMRRLEPKEKKVWSSDGLEVFLKEFQVKKGEQVLNLSKTEWQLLLCLLENPGQIMSREQMLDKVWGLDGQFVDENTVTVNISRLKNKLGTDCITNVRGLGYIWTGEVVRR
ncbi:MAG: response regulator transcription factor [Lachnospiraceae bacterium]|nr:response regulator transcription factor [Lachnospiraceae bacterium]